MAVQQPLALPAVVLLALAPLLPLALLLLAAPGGEAHGDPRLWPINPELGVSGFPDCRRLHPELRNLTMEEASFDLDCTAPAPRPDGDDDAIRIACVGDSITAGVHSSGGNHTYPFQLQMALDKQHGWGKQHRRRHGQRAAELAACWLGDAQPAPGE